MSFNVTPQKEQVLFARMARLGIREQDIDEKFVTSSGKGGQHLNKTASCVYLKHLPSGIEVKCQRERSQSINRYVARVILADHLEARMLGAQSKEEQRREKIRRQKRRRSRRAKDKMLDDKRHHAQKKALRSTSYED